VPGDSYTRAPRRSNTPFYQQQEYRHQQKRSYFLLRRKVGWQRPFAVLLCTAQMCVLQVPLMHSVASFLAVTMRHAQCNHQQGNMAYLSFVSRFVRSHVLMMLTHLNDVNVSGILHLSKMYRVPSLCAGAHSVGGCHEEFSGFSGFWTLAQQNFTNAFYVVSVDLDTTGNSV
jgi:hypothetical protein